MAATFTVDIVSDVVCPWCYVGKRNFEAALAEFPDIQFDVRWRAYQLDPTIPQGGVDRKTYMERKFGGKATGVHDRLVEVGGEVGIPFDSRAIRISPNTLDAHRLLRWAQASGPGAQNALAERLFQDYFVEGRDVGDREVLIAAARDCGMDADDMARRLDSDVDKDAVQAEIIDAQNIGVTGVPFFILEGAFALPGAQPKDVFVRAIRKTLAREGRDVAPSA